MPNKNKQLSASDLAELGFCERKIYLKSKYGNRVTSEQSTDRLRGNVIHEEIYKERASKFPSDKRCYIATCIYGADATETKLLRNWRDDFLLKSILGKIFIGVYYKVSPFIVRKLGNNCLFRLCSKFIIDSIIYILSKTK